MFFKFKDWFEFEKTKKKIFKKTVEYLKFQKLPFAFQKKVL